MKTAAKALLIFTLLILSIQVSACSEDNVVNNETTDSTAVIKPKVITDALPHDTDDPAIWINSEDVKKSLVIGTDKNVDGGLYAFDLNGHILPDKTVKPLKRPNNVDVEYGLKLNGKPVDIAVVTERLTHKLRIFRMPDMAPLDKGGIEVFKGETGAEERDLMGISLYRRPDDGTVFAIIGRKTGPSGSYLWQYFLEDDGTGHVKATLVRKFGKFSGKKEIEAIAVDDQLGYIYYSDEGVGVRKYYADPLKGNKELALFAKEGFQEDHEGISIYNESDKTGYILVSDQAANEFHIFPREGTDDNPHNHPLLKVVKLATIESDGSEVTSEALGSRFPKGLFVAMSNNRTFQYYRWEDIINGIK